MDVPVNFHGALSAAPGLEEKESLGIPQLPFCEAVEAADIPMLPQVGPQDKGWGAFGNNQPEPQPEEDDDPLGSLQEVISHAYEMKVEDNFMDRGKTEIHAWTLDQKSNPYLLRIQDFPIFCHMELPQFVDGKPMEWDEGSAGQVVSWLVKVLAEDAPTKWIYAMKPKLYHFQGDKKYPMILMMFDTVKAMYHCQNLINKPRKIPDIGTIKLDMWETSISIIRKLFSLQTCRYAQWFKIIGQEVPLNHEHRITNEGNAPCRTAESKSPCDPVEAQLRKSLASLPQIPLREFVVQWKTLLAIPPDVSGGWSTKPRILSFDIETYSDNHRAMPNEFNAKHVAYMISCVYQRLGDQGSRRQFGIIRGDCDDIPGCEVIRVNDEIDEVAAMAHLIQLLDVEIVTGYNILGYDYPYLDVRLKTKMQDWPQMGRIEGRVPKMTSKEWKSSAYGFNRINLLQMDGRISIDMLPIIRRDYKLDKYDLDFVCKHFLKEGKHDIKAAEMFRIYERLERARERVEAPKDAAQKVRREAEKELRRADAAKGQALMEIQLRVENAMDRVEEEQAYGKVSPQAEAELAKAKAEMTRVMAYCIQDAALVIKLFEKLNIWIGLLELASIVGVTITDLFTRGQQIRCQSQIYNLASFLGYVLDKRFMDKMFFNGGFVFEPKPGLYDNIICFDFASLYPSIMEAYNICFTTLVPPELYDQVPDSDCNIIEFDQDEPISGKPKYQDGNQEDEGIIEGVNDEAEDESDEKEEKESKTVRRHYKFKFVKASVRVGVLPRLVHDLVFERRQVKAQIKDIEGQIKSLDKLEGSLKTSTPADLLTTSQEALSKYEARLKDHKDNVAKLTKAEFLDITDKAKHLRHVVNFLKPHAHATSSDVIAALKVLIESLQLQLVVLDKRQLALKISANSMFGFLGAQNGVMPLIEGAMCITARGRQLISSVNVHLQTKYDADIIYNDTDSSMVDLHITDPKECDAWGNRLAAEINGTPEIKLDDGTVIPAVTGLFPPPLAVEFEKAMRFLVFKKKMYVYYLIGRDGQFVRDKNTGEIKLEKKGVMIARRGKTKLAQGTYLSILRNVMDRESVDVAYTTLIDAIMKLLRGEFQARQLTMIQELGGDYKNTNYFMNVFAGELRNMGKPVNPGDRLEYVIVKTQAELDGQEVLLGKKMRAIEMWEESQEESRKAKKKPSRLKVVREDDIPLLPGVPSPTKDVYPAENIDYIYYIEHALMNPIDQLFEVGYSKVLPKYEEIGYKPQHSRCRYESVKKPVKMLGKMITDLLRGASQYAGNEADKLKIIADDHIAGLPNWFKKRRADVDAKLAAAETSRQASLAANAQRLPLPGSMEASLKSSKPSRLNIVRRAPAAA